MSPQPLDEATWLRIRILLAIQSALLGEIPTCLVAVGLLWSDEEIEARFYYERGPDDEEVSV